jgi:hypothetical protein
MRVLLYAIVVASAVTTCLACSSSSPSSPDSSPDSGTGGSGADGADTGATPDSSPDSEAAEAAPLSADCQRLYNCCVGAEAQTPQFCTGLVGQGICDVWLQSYAMAGTQCP